MKISYIPRVLNTKKITNTQRDVQSKPINTQRPNYPVHFYGLIKPNITEEITNECFLAAQKYLERHQKTSSYSAKSLDFLDLDKLDGIQHGIKVFRGMNMKQIAFICKNMNEVTAYRGCSSKCSCCHLEAIPQYFKPDSDKIKQMDWEDFDSLMGGIKELSNRLGFNPVTQKDYTIPALFRDTDGIEVEMKDAKKKVYDYTDAAELFYEATNKKVLFDTSGWSPRIKKYQVRAEKIVSDFLTKGDSIAAINVSINPFHILYETSLEAEKLGDSKKATKFRNLYTDRMANTLFTFTPVFKDRRFKILSSVRPGNDTHDMKALNQLKTEIFDKLRELYLKDYNSDKKYIQNEWQIASNLRAIKNKPDASRNVGKMGRAEQFFSPDEKDIEWEGMTNREAFIKTIKHSSTLIDSNGKIYATNGHLVAPTELQLNFKNKDKETLPPNKIIEDFTVTNQMIEKWF